MNELPHKLIIGTLGEIFTQLRLLEYGVQSVSPHKDTGNDLIAIKGEIFRTIQIKTTFNPEGHTRIPPDLDRAFHILALVELKIKDGNLSLDESKIFLLWKEQSFGERKLLTKSLVSEFWL